MAENGEGHAQFVVDRVFAGSPETIWRTWTEPELLTRWYKPNPKCQAAVLQHDLRPGGVMLYQMRFGDTPRHHERWEFDVIEPPRRLQWRQMLADADGNMISNARMPDWPRVMQGAIELEPHHDGTSLRMTWKPHDATEAEMACFREFSGSAGEQGWLSAFDILGELLKELVAP